VAFRLDGVPLRQGERYQRKDLFRPAEIPPYLLVQNRPVLCSLLTVRVRIPLSPPAESLVFRVSLEPKITAFRNFGSTIAEMKGSFCRDASPSEKAFAVCR
jgi:hypothetical protein